MKKILITTLLLTGVVSPVKGVDYKGSFNRGANTPLTFKLDAKSPITIDSVSAVMTAAVSGAATDKEVDNKPNPLPEATPAVYKDTSTYTSTFTPDTNIGIGGTWTLTLNFTNTSTTTKDITAITFDYFLFDGKGNLQSDNTKREIQFSLSGAVSSTQTFDAENDLGTSQPLIFNLKENYISLAAGESATINLHVQEGVTYGTYVGLRGASFSVIPEPATATLSLLALCGLAARRRRK